MANKQITMKSQDGVTIVFNLNQIILKGETVVKFADGKEWSDGAAKTYVYGDSYIAKIPDEMFAQLVGLLVPAEPEVNPEAEVPAE